MFIQDGEARIFATALGDPSAPAIVGVGGWVGSWELWLEPFALLSRTWRTIAYDHRGAGATSAPLETITHEQLVEDVFTVMDAYGARRCVLAAESAGAMTALAAALADPERIAGLVIVGGLYHREPPGDDDPFVRALRADYRGTLGRFAGACVPEPGCGHIRRWGQQILERAEPEAAVALLRVAADLRPQAARIGQPALVVHGERDSIVPVAEGRWLADALPDARLLTLPDAGHVPTMTRPAEVAAAIDERFAGLR